MDEFIIKPNVTEQTILVVDDSNITRNLIEKVYHYTNTPIFTHTIPLSPSLFTSIII